MLRPALLLLGAALALVSAAPATAADLLYAVDVNGGVVRFSSERPGAVTPVRLTGIDGERVVGLDVRPVDSSLYVLTAGSRIYRVDTATGAAAVVGAGPFEVGVNGTFVGFDINPSTDRIRIVSEAGQNLRVNPENGETARRGGQLDVDVTPTYASGDPGAGTTPRLTALAHTNNVAGVASADVLVLAIDAARDTLSVLTFPNRGVLETRGALGVDTTDNAGFDVTPAGVAYAALQTPGQTGSSLYTIDAATGAATLVGPIGGAAIGSLAALGSAPPPEAEPPPPAPPATRPLSLRIASVTAPARTGALVTAGVTVRASCSRACTLAGTLRLGRVAVGSAQAPKPGTSLRIHFSPAGRKLLLGRPRAVIALQLTATAADGASARANRTIRTVR